jgi:hypothetical protein
VTSVLDRLAHLEARVTALDRRAEAADFHRVIQGLERIMAELDDLKAAVARETEVDESAIVLLNGLKAKLDAAIAAGDPAALKALSDSLGTESQKLADAVTANTPAA